MTKPRQPGKTFGMGKRHVPMSALRLLQSDVSAGKADSRARRSAGKWLTNRLPTKKIPICSQNHKCGGDQLWTMRALAVDGLGVRLRGFRKSHHFIGVRSRGIRKPGQGAALGHEDRKSVV